MRRAIYKKSLWMSLVMLMASVNAVFGQTELTAGGELASGSYYLKSNLTITTPIKVENGKTVTIDLNGYVLCGNFTKSDYVLVVEEGGTLTIEDSKPDFGHEGYLDDGMFVWPYVAGKTKLAVPGGIIYNKRKSSDIATQGISVGGTCIIEEAKIMGCYSTAIASAVAVTSSGRFTMKKGQISYNYSKTNGVVYGEPSHNNSGSMINISNTIISDNKSDGLGGAICGYNVTLNNCTIERNSTAQDGGAIYMHRTGDSKKDGSLSITSCNINDNSAKNGGAVFSGAGVTTTIGGITTLSGNKATTYGGGIYASALSIKGSVGSLVQIKKNTAIVGGGIYVNGESNIDYCNLESNYATTNGGGIYAKANTVISNSTIQKNRAMSTEPQEWILNSNNERVLVNKGRGGGFFFIGEKEDLSANSGNPVFTLSNTVVTENACMYYGGGGQICTGGTLNLNDGSRIDNNKAVLHGAGGLHVTATARFNFNSGSISYNKATTVGGAIHSSYGCELNFNGGVIQGNFANQRGGGVHINTGGEMVLNGTQIISNTVTRGKDALYADVIFDAENGTYNYENVQFAESKEESTYTLDEDGNVEYSGYGGGVLIDSGTLTMNSGSISGNFAEIAGGGVALVMIRVGDLVGSSNGDFNGVLSDSRFYNYKVVNFTLNNGQIVGNSTTKESSAAEEERLNFQIGNGAGVYIMENVLKKKLGELLTEDEWKKYSNGKGDYAKYRAIYEGISSANVNGGIIGENQATGRGGGLFLQAGNVVMNNFSMTENTAVFDGGGLYLHNGELAIGNNTGNIVSNNEANNGGGVCIANGTLSIGYCDITENTASQFGGGVYVANTNEVEINLTGGGVFEGNTASAGGGMAVGGPITLNFEGSIQNNTADNGGGIYLLPGSVATTGEPTGPQLIVEGGYIRDNKANGTSAVGTGYEGTVESIKGFGGGAFLGSGTSLSFAIKKNEFTDELEFGFYNNKANIGGDDIFANGISTTVSLPNVTFIDDANPGMNLKDFDVPTESIFWVEDYVTDDSKYSTNGANMIGETTDNVRRYRDALRSSSLIYKIEKEQFETVKNKYLCLALGYKILYMTIKKYGLQVGESAIFNIYNIKDDKEALYATALLHYETSTDDGLVSQKVAVPEGATMRVEENAWTWNYSQEEVSHKDGKITIVLPDSESNVGNASDDVNTITFTNKILTSDRRQYDEAIKVNTMGTSSSGTSENK